MNALRQRLLNTSDTPCDLIALAAEAVHAPATSPAAHSHQNDDSSDACLSPRKHHASALRSHLPEASKRRRPLSPTNSVFGKNEIVLIERPKPTTAIFEPALGPLGPDYDEDLLVDKPLDPKDLPCCELRDSRSALKQNAEVVALHVLKHVPEVVTNAPDPTSPAGKPVTKTCSFRSSDFSTSEAAFEAGVRVSQQVLSHGAEPEEKVTPLVPYSLTSNGISSTREKGSCTRRKFRTGSYGPDDDIRELAPVDRRGRMRAATPSIPAVRFQAEVQEDLINSGRAVDTKLKDKRSSTERYFRGNVSRSHRAKKAKKQGMFFSKPSGSQFDELLSCGRLDKHLLIQERTFQRVQVGAMQSFHVAQSVRVQKGKSTRS